MSLSMHVDTKKNIITLGKSLTQGLGDTTLSVEAENSFNFMEQGKKFYITMEASVLIC